MSKSWCNSTWQCIKGHFPLKTRKFCNFLGTEHAIAFFPTDSEPWARGGSTNFLVRENPSTFGGLSPEFDQFRDFQGTFAQFWERVPPTTPERQKSCQNVSKDAPSHPIHEGKVLGAIGQHNVGKFQSDSANTRGRKNHCKKKWEKIDQIRT